MVVGTKDLGGLMAQARCRNGKHRYQTIPGNGVGVKRKKCVSCGSVMIDLREEIDESERVVGLFAPRKPTLFSVKALADEEQGSGGFGRPRHR
ncbi:MAG TPA: hypothetical protein VM470_01680 [Acidimicrobiia bacterium]|nr:hypothetical protein [Acidimicrobiia bacterium]